MKKYIGTKQIEAEPMTMGEAYEKGLLQAGRVPNEAQKANPGYHVRYEDGYESWSPAEPFEKAYRVSDTFMDRLQIERNDLEVRVAKLEDFLKSEAFNLLPGIQQRLLNEQYDIMRAYLVVLDARITLLKKII